MNHLSISKSLFVIGLLAVSVAPLPALPALPEPPVVFYGRVTTSSPAPDLASVTFTLTGNSETFTTPPPAQIVTLEGQSYYIVRIPFETRGITGGQALTATPNTLALPTVDTTYTVTAKVGSSNATLPAGKDTILYSAQRQGLIQRIDLTLGGETFDQWSQRIFGSVVDANGDEDHDGRSNHDEFLAGTDPLDPASRFIVETFTPLPGGGFSITWDTVPGKTYRVERSTSFANGEWQILESGAQGDGTHKTFHDTNPGTAPRLFYRIAVSPTE
jgi:hypothetical protein